MGVLIIFTSTPALAYGLVDYLTPVLPRPVQLPAAGRGRVDPPLHRHQPAGHPDRGLGADGHGGRVHGRAAGGGRGGRAAQPLRELPPALPGGNRARPGRGHPRLLFLQRLQRHRGPRRRGGAPAAQHPARAPHQLPDHRRRLHAGDPGRARSRALDRAGAGATPPSRAWPASSCPPASARWWRRRRCARSPPPSTASCSPRAAICSPWPWTACCPAVADAGGPVRRAAHRAAVHGRGGHPGRADGPELHRIRRACPCSASWWCTCCRAWWCWCCRGAAPSTSKPRGSAWARGPALLGRRPHRLRLRLHPGRARHRYHRGDRVPRLLPPGRGLLCPAAAHAAAPRPQHRRAHPQPRRARRAAPGPGRAGAALPSRA